MDIAYFDPLKRAWDRMKEALFKPFNLNKWFVVGFNAFLAGLIDNGNRGSGSGSRGGGDLSFREFLNFPHKAWDWLLSHPGWFIAIIFVGLVLIALMIVLTWVSSRGKFMFLDNVVRDSAEIAKPWKQYKKEGNSLFLWRLGFGLICFIFFILFIALFFSATSNIYQANYYSHVPVAFIIWMGLFFLFAAIVTGYIALYLKDFVVPLMYKNNITTCQAWKRFLTLFKQHLLHFLFYGLFIFVLSFLVIISLIIAGLLTCCVGILLLIIPYIGTVVTLPFWYTFRAFSLEYLAQFGPDYNLFPPAEELPAAVKT